MYEKHKKNIDDYIFGKPMVFKGKIVQKCIRCDGQGGEEVNSFLGIFVPCDTCLGKGHLVTQNEFTDILYNED